VNEEGQLATKGGANVRCYLKDQEGNDLCKVQVVDKRNGTYICTYVSPSPGMAILNVQIGKDNIQNSPFHPEVIPGEPDPGKTVCSGPGLSEAEAGVTTEFYIQTKDINGKNLPQGGANISAQFDDPHGVKVKITDNGDGTYVGQYTPITAHKAKLSVIVNTEHLGKGHANNSPFTVHVSPSFPDAAHTVASGDGLHGGHAGNQANIHVQVRDKFDNKVTKGGAPIHASLNSPNESQHIAVIDHDDGTYSLQYTPTAAGHYKVHVKLGDQPIAHSPFDVHITAGSFNPLNFTWDGIDLDTDGKRYVVAGETESFSVTARDSYGNPLTSGGLSIKGTIQGPGKVPVETNDHQNGTYQLSFTPEKTGLYTFTVTVNNDKIGGSKNPFGMVCIPAGPSAENTIAYGPGLKSAQIGKENVFTVESRDRFDNPLTEGGANVGGVLVGENDIEVPILVTDNEDGTYTCAYPGVKVSGDYKIIPLLEDTPVKGAPFLIHVLPGEISVDNTDIALPEYHVSGLEGPVITLRDEHLNAKKKGGDKIVAVIKRKTRLPPVKAHSKDDGTYEIDYPASLKGDYEASVTVNGKDAPGGPWNIDVEPTTLSEHHQTQIARIASQATNPFLRLLNNASEAERDKILHELETLKKLSGH
jgi:hypothetical protein